jgi:phage host-nuclease inhibitor protein Gam
MDTMSLELEQSVITELVINPLDQEVSTQGEKWRVRDLSSAEYAMQKMKLASDRISEAKTFCNARKKRLDDWLDEYIKDYQQTIEFFTGAMRDYTLSQLEGQKKTKTLKLPGGTGSFKKEQPKYQRDEDKLLAWVEEFFPDFIRVTKEVAWDELKKKTEVINGRMVIWEEKEHIPFTDCIEKNGTLLDSEGEMIGHIVAGVHVDENVPDKFTIKLS